MQLCSKVKLINENGVYMHNKKVTIHDIAEALSFGRTTVSRALKDSDRVNQKTKNLVLDKAKEMGYQPNYLASKLRKKKTRNKTIIMIPSLIERKSTQR